MDIILFAICLLFFLKGYFKGFISMLFSFIGFFIAVFVAWKMTPVFIHYTENYIGNAIFSSLSNFLNDIFPGNFTSMEDLSLSISQSKYGFIFSYIFEKLFKNLTFEGNLTAGQILSPTLTQLLLSVITFAILCVALLIMVKIFVLIANFAITKSHFQTGNRILGGLVGCMQGVILFGVGYIVLVSISNFTLNLSLQNFLEQGIISKFLYDNLIIKIINLFY